VGNVLYRLADDNAQTNPVNNHPSSMPSTTGRCIYSYAGYLRRDADIGGFLFWLGQVNGGTLRDATKTARDGLRLVTAARISATIQPVRDTYQSRVFSIVAVQLNWMTTLQILLMIV